MIVTGVAGGPSYEEEVAEAGTRLLIASTTFMPDITMPNTE
jgi:hypothetical protein